MDKGFSLDDIEFKTALPTTTTDDEDYERVLALGERVEEAKRTCKLNEFLEDLKPFMEDLKIAKGLIFKFTFPKNIDEEIRGKYFLEVGNNLRDNCIYSIFIDYEDIDKNSISYEFLMSGLPLKN
ncbi:MAG: hypothetical protein PHY49_03880 [Aliarcobacter skirrowii]|nr:hypothetical protein [Aliarcobacter skirrowii]